MWEFIVSGRLPGTTIQVSFETWMQVITGVAGLVIVALAVRLIVRRKRSAASLRQPA